MKLGFDHAFFTNYTIQLISVWQYRGFTYHEKRHAIHLKKGNKNKE